MAVARLFPHHLRCVAHLAEFVEDRVEATGADEQHFLGQPPGDLRGELLPREQFFGEHRVLGENEAHAAVQLGRKASGRVGHERFPYAETRQ